MSPMFVPGPVDVAPEVLKEQTKPMLPHRSKDFEATFQGAIEKLRQVFYTQYRVFIMTNSGSGAQEAAVRNLANERVLSCVNGSFSKRWYDVAIANGVASLVRRVFFELQFFADSGHGTGVT